MLLLLLLMMMILSLFSCLCLISCSQYNSLMYGIMRAATAFEERDKARRRIQNQAAVREAARTLLATDRIAQDLAQLSQAEATEIQTERERLRADALSMRFEATSQPPDNMAGAFTAPPQASPLLHGSGLVSALNQTPTRHAPISASERSADAALGTIAGAHTSPPVNALTSSDTAVHEQRDDSAARTPSPNQHFASQPHNSNHHSDAQDAVTLTPAQQALLIAERRQTAAAASHHRPARPRVAPGSHITRSAMQSGC